MNIRSIIKPLFQIDKHMALVPETALVLKSDGKEEIYNLLYMKDEATGKKGVELLAEGTADADKPLSGGYINTLWHFHHPWSHRGYLTRKSSADVADGLFKRALALWQNGERGDAFYQLGRALHLLQDIFIPQHAGIAACKGHGPLEKWLTKNSEAYLVSEGGYYYWETSFRKKFRRHHVKSDRTYDWIDHGSHLSIDWFNKYFAHSRYDEDTFREVATLIIPHALRFSAGFLNKFFTEAGFLLSDPHF